MMLIEERRIDFDPRGDLVLTIDVDVNLHGDPVENANESVATAATVHSPGHSETSTSRSGHVLQDIESSDDVPAPNADGNVSSSHVDACDAEPESAVVHDALCLVRAYKFRVSSKHLELGSKFFSEMFQNSAWGDNEIPLHGDNVGALKILLNVIHGFHSKVPKCVKRKTLLEILKLIDKYEFMETDMFTESWYSQLRAEIPTGPDRRLTEWLFICYKLRHTADFENLTKIAVVEGLSVSRSATEARISHIIAKILARRSTILSEISAIFSDTIELYQSSEMVCERNRLCDVLALGLLIKGLSERGLYPLCNLESYSGSVRELLSVLRKVDLGYRCSVSELKVNRADPWNTKGYDPSSPNPHVEDRIKRKFLELEAKIQGLCLSDFPPL